MLDCMKIKLINYRQLIHDAMEFAKISLLVITVFIHRQAIKSKFEANNEEKKRHRKILIKQRKKKLR